MPAPYYNTVHESPTELRRSRENANIQERQVLALFRANPTALFTPFQVHARVFGPNVPIQSTRRAITNLTDQGHLEKTDEKRLGEWGKVNYCWRLARTKEKVQGVLF